MYRQTSLFRYQLIVGLMSLGATLLYLGIFRPLSRRAVELDRSLQSVWRKLADINIKNQARLGWDEEIVAENRRFAERSFSALQRAAQRTRDLLEFDAAVGERLQEPFQFLDYEQQRLRMIDDLRNLAAAKKVGLEPGAVAGYPEYTFGKEKPNLLWAQLAVVNRILTAAVASGPSTVRSLSLLPARIHNSPEGGRVLYEEYPARLEFTGPTASVFDFLLSLSGNVAGTNAAGASPSASRPLLFINDIILKASTNSPNEVALEAVVSGFLNREKFP
jgi:hypothetical protein